MAKHTKLRSVVAWIFGIYAAIVVLCNLPFMQRTFADWTANALSKQLKTEVQISGISLGFLNNIIINDMYVEDQNHHEMLKVARASASINIFKLIANGEIDISTAQLFGAKANLYKKNPAADYNFQFIIDAFKSDDKESKPINLHINSLIVRRADIRHNVLSESKKQTFDLNHLNIKNAGFNLSLKQFTPDSINATLKRFSANEQNSNLCIEEIAFRLIGNNKEANLTDFVFRLPRSEAEIDSLHVCYANYSDTKSFTFDETTLNGTIAVNELKFISPKLADIDYSFNLSTILSGSDKNLNIEKFLISSDNDDVKAAIIAKVNNYSSASPSINADIRTLKIEDGELQKLISAFIDNTDQLTPLFNAGSLNYRGTLVSENNNITSEGELITDAGEINYSAFLNNEKLLTAQLETRDIDVKRILDNESFGILNLNAEGVVNLSSSNPIPEGSLYGKINNVDYNGYKYSNITIDAKSNASDLVLKASSEDENIDFTIDGTLSNIQQATRNINAAINVRSINPYALKLTDKFVGERYSFNLNTIGSFTDINHLQGNATLRDIVLTTSDGTQTIENVVIDASLDGSSQQSLTINSDFLNADITGRFRLDELAADFQNITSHHLPLLVDHKPTSAYSDINYNITFQDAPIIHHFVKENYSVEKPIHIVGNLNSQDNSLNMLCNAPQLSFNDNSFKDLRINCSSSQRNMMVTVQGANHSDNSSTKGKIIAIAHKNKVDSDIQLSNEAKDKLNLNLFATTDFTKFNGNLMTDFKIQKSRLFINNDEWDISPANINYCKNQLECHNFRISNGNQYLEINGRASEDPNDSLTVNLNDIEIAYILDLVNFHSVEFGGKASGHAIVNNIFGKPDANAHLYVHQFSLQGGVLGDASILAHWDKEREGIAVNAHIVDSYESRVGLTDIYMPTNGVLNVNGYIMPIGNEISLDIGINDVRPDFLSGFLDDIITNINGKLNGNISVVGPFNDINLIGDAVADISFQLRATKVPYCISSGDTIRFRHHLFDFTDVNIHDRQNNVGVFNGQMTHRNLANFTYDFRADVTNLCVYNEKEFNADKFLAQVWADGDVHIYGSDGHGVTIDANVSPCKGSVFAYDSATPDALVSNSFIDFHDITNGPSYESTPTYLTFGSDSTSSDTVISHKSNYKYLGDLYMNVNIDLNPNCEVKLRMDNTKDGYISTFGNGSLRAQWYNKGSFQLFGNYNINAGKYRLYLQDLVYRNLDIQDGSKVEFNGNPFDANLHLICKHEINSVPLSDLTKTTAFSSNNKAKVDCFLDITGRLDNMDLKFSFELPNVSEETRQLVRSMINSDEEMNKQMIYLLGFQRFYPNELAQSNIEDYGTQAVNSLLSSTISGQINQMLSNMIGTSSKWNFGTGITTGENGWQDLDVEGILSGRLLNDRLLINGNFGYRDNSLTNQANFIGDFEVKYRIWESGDFYVKAYNQTNDRYFTKATLNTQGVGLSFQHDFEKYTLFGFLKKLGMKKASE